MTMLMLAGVVQADTPAPGAAPDHLRVTAGRHMALALSVPSDLDWSGEAATILLAQGQHALLCRYAEICDVVPIALGGLFSGPEAVRSHLADEAGRLSVLFGQMSGCVEYTLKICRLPDPPGPVAAASGQAHLRQRARLRDNRLGRTTARRDFVTGLSDSMAPLTKAQRSVAGRTPDRLARIDFLIARDRLSSCRSQIEARLPEAAALGLALSLTGPYPVFSFAPDDFETANFATDTLATGPDHG